MKLAFCLFNYFPYGGLQRDCLRIAHTCLSQGHSVDIYTMSWQGDPPSSEITVHIVPVSGLQNHTRAHSFAESVANSLKQHDLVLGFNKMPYLDLYYGADICYKYRAYQERSWWYRLLPRYRSWVALEQAVFNPEGKTQILVISPFQQAEYAHSYHTPEHRFHFLPPGLDTSRKAPNNAAEIRQRTRMSHGIDDEEKLLLFVGSDFKRKGLDRALIALASLPRPIRARTRLFVVGQYSDKKFRQQAAQLGIAQQVSFLGGRKDVPELLLAADLFLHPAYHENTGTVILEALIAGLPALVTDVCGYAHYVQEAKAGRVLASPFAQANMNQTLLTLLTSPDHEQWRHNGLLLAHNPEIYAMPERVAKIIETMGSRLVSCS